MELLLPQHHLLRLPQLSAQLHSYPLEKIQCVVVLAVDAALHLQVARIEDGGDELDVVGAQTLAAVLGKAEIGEGVDESGLADEGTFVLDELEGELVHEVGECAFFLLFILLCSQADDVFYLNVFVGEEDAVDGGREVSRNCETEGVVYFLPLLPHLDLLLLPHHLPPLQKHLPYLVVRFL